MDRFREHVLKKFLLGLIVVAGLAQFIRPAKNLSSAPSPNDISVSHPMSADVQSLLKRACYDCHSNQTHYPWYAEVQPVAWWLARHVTEGKEHLNFSEFASYTLKRKANKLDEISDEVSQHSMPLPSYTWVHPEARLTTAEIKQLIDWADALREEIAPE